MGVLEYILFQPRELKSECALGEAENGARDVRRLVRGAEFLRESPGVSQHDGGTRRGEWRTLVLPVLEDAATLVYSAKHFQSLVWGQRGERLLACWSTAPAA